MERLMILYKEGIGVFNCKNSVLKEESYEFQTLEEAYQLSIDIANKTSNPNENLVICELLNNAIEHGNLGITYEEKTYLIEKDLFLDEVSRRLKLKENKHKHAEVHIKTCTEGGMIVTISDQGKGFDYNKYLSIDNSRIFESHGRGIAIANNLLRIQYLGNGNQVAVYFPN